MLSGHPRVRLSGQIVLVSPLGCPQVTLSSAPGAPLDQIPSLDCPCVAPGAPPENPHSAPWSDPQNKQPVFGSPLGYPQVAPKGTHGAPPGQTARTSCSWATPKSTQVVPWAPLGQTPRMDCPCVAPRAPPGQPWGTPGCPQSDLKDRPRPLVCPWDTAGSPPGPWITIAPNNG